MMLTPSFWLTVAGIVLVALGHPTPAGICLLVVGWGGVGISLKMGTDKDPWRVDTVVEVIVRVLRGELKAVRVGLLVHLPQAVIGILLLGLG